MSRTRSILIVFSVLVLLASQSIIGFLVDHWWFESLDKQNVFWKIIYVKALIFVCVFLLFSGMLLSNVYLAFHFTKGQKTRSIEGLALPTDRILKVLAFFTIMVISILGASASVGWWEEILRFVHGSEFGNHDPIFDLDIGFYFFKLPFYQALRGWGVTAIILSIVLSGVVYFIKGITGFIKDWTNPFMKNTKYHISFLLLLLAVFMAMDFWLDRYELLYSDSGVVFGAGYTDIHARLLANSVMTVVSIVGAFLILLSVFWRKGFSLILVAASAFLVAHFGLKLIYPSVLQKYVVGPNELLKEKPYIAHNIKYTRLAYGLDKIERRSFTADGSLSRADIQKNQATVDNIRLWDWRPLLTTYKQIQEIRPYYNFNDVDIDRYMINGKKRQVMIAARELSYEQIPENAKNWVNQRFEYRNGQGVVMSPVNRVASNGQPEFFIKDIPPTSSVGLKIDRPEIFYGEDTNHYIFSKLKAAESKGADGSDNADHFGVSISSFWKKLIYAAYYKDFNILISDYLSEDSKIHYVRNVVQRVRKIAPFLIYENDPYIIISEGKLYWIIDAYALSDRHPYSQPIQFAGGRFNYIRNSVKVLVDAYTGNVKYIITDPKEPMIQTYRKIFPKLFTDMKDVSKDIRQHFKYPQELFRVQASIYSTYHMSSPDVFYKKEDMWQTPSEIYGSNEQPMEPYYVTLKLSENKEKEFMLILPFTPLNKNNMIAWMAAHCDIDNYGKIVLYEFSRKKLIYGPMQVEARIDQDPEISELLTLWNQKGSNVIRGNLLTIPIEDSILYIEPIYLQAEQGQMPELKRVVVAHNENIFISDNLESSLLGALDKRGRSYSSDKTSSPQDDISSLVKEAVNLFNRSQKDIKNTNWESYGKNQEELGDILKEIQRISQGK